MNKLLTIAMPTYNRARLLDKQLEWFADAIQGQEHLCELAISDNCSTDETPAVVRKWEQYFRDTPLRVRTYRNSHNVGPIRNIAAGINRAEGRFVWTVGDDDTIVPHALAFVLDTIQKHPDLHLLVFNFSSRHCETGELKYPRCFEVSEDQIADCGQKIVEQVLTHPDPTRWGGLVLTTALIYRTPVAQASLWTWPEGVDNLYLQFYVTTYCAMHGKTILTKENYLEMSEGRHFFTGNKPMLFRFKMAELPESLVKVAGLGYSPEICLEKVTLQRRKISSGKIRRFFLDDPLGTLDLLRRHRRAVRQIKTGRVPEFARAGIHGAFAPYPVLTAFSGESYSNIRDTG